LTLGVTNFRSVVDQVTLAQTSSFDKYTVAIDALGDADGLKLFFVDTVAVDVDILAFNWARLLDLEFTVDGRVDIGAIIFGLVT